MTLKVFLLGILLLCLGTFLYLLNFIDAAEIFILFGLFLFVVGGTAPTNPDTDGDGLSDGDEVSGGTDPKDPNDPPPP